MGLSEIITFLISFAGIVITILLIVGVHEFGHFLVAKCAGIKVLRFSIGFGKKLLCWQDKTGTEYVIAAIPLGGYVKLLDETEGKVTKEELHLSFNRQPLWKRTLVVAAGPFFNLVFALLIYWIVFMIGFTSMAPIIGKITPHSIAEQAGLKPQQQILTIDNHSTLTWMSVFIRILSRTGDTGEMQFQIKNMDKQTLEMHALSLKTWQMDELKPDPLGSLGITPYEPLIAPFIHSIFPDSPAAHSSLQVGDKIISIGKTPIQDWQALTTEIAKYPDKKLLFKILRQGKTIDLEVDIGSQTHLFKKYGYLGVIPQFNFPQNFFQTNQYGPIQAFGHAWENTSNFTYLNFLLLGKLFLGKLSAQSLGGPITIFESAGNAIHQGIVPFLSFLAFLSIAIGIINVLPIPGLDGGHILFQVFELCMRRPLSMQTQLWMYRLGILFLMIVFFQALVNDVLRLYS